MQIVVKTRYKQFTGSNTGKGSKNPFSNSTGRPKDKGMNQYLDYIIDGAKTAEGEFSDNFTHEAELDLEKVTASEMKQYQQYMEYRKGSELLFGTEGIPVKELKEQLLELEKQNHGGCYIPIVSMKEKDAIDAGCDSQQKWIENTHEYVKKYAEIVGIPEGDVRFIAAFHLKDEKERNPKSDAGKQPHVHLIIWDAMQRKSNLKMSHKQVDKIRELADDIWCGDYYRQFYQERNDLRKSMTDGFLDNALEQMRGRINTLVCDISIATNNHGRLNQKALKDNAEMLAQIRQKQLAGKDLKKGEEDLLGKFEIDSAEKLNKKIIMFAGINKELDDVVREVLNSSEMKPALDRWREVSLQIKQGKGGTAGVESMVSDEEKMVETLKNRILNYAKEVIPQGKNAYKVPDGAKQMELLHKIDYMKFKPYVTKDKAESAIDTMVNLMHVYRIPANVASQKMNELLRRSNVSLNPRDIERAIQEEYAKPAVLTSTSYEVGYSMGCLGYDRPSGSSFTRDLYELYEWRSLDLATLGYVRKSIDELSYAELIGTPGADPDFYQSEYDRIMEQMVEERYAELEAKINSSAEIPAQNIDAPVVETVEHSPSKPSSEEL